MTTVKLIALLGSVVCCGIFICLFVWLLWSDYKADKELEASIYNSRIAKIYAMKEELNKDLPDWIDPDELDRCIDLILQHNNPQEVIEKAIAEIHKSNQNEEKE